MTIRKQREASAQLALSIEAPPVATARKPGNEVLVATWNVNSIRAHMGLIEDWLKRTEPDVVCLQETKVADNLFPFEAFSKLGYHVAAHGEGGRNGVAILSRNALHSVAMGIDYPRDTEARAISVSIGSVRIVCIYAPNAYSVSDEGFERKLAWLRQLNSHLRSQRERYRCLLVCGDFNVTPHDTDLHDSSRWIYKTFVHPEARAALHALAEGLSDLHRRVNGDAKGFTWWDYRNNAFAQDHGIRIDHLYATEALAANCVEVFVDKDVRRATKPSDHAPVVCRLKLTEDWISPIVVSS